MTYVRIVGPWYELGACLGRRLSWLKEGGVLVVRWDWRSRFFVLVLVGFD